MKISHEKAARLLSMNNLLLVQEGITVLNTQLYKY